MECRFCLFIVCCIFIKNTTGTRIVPPKPLWGVAAPGKQNWPQHVPFRIALVVVWLGANKPPESLNFFLSSVHANKNLVDLLLFHEDNHKFHTTVEHFNASNVFLYDLKTFGITSLIAQKLGTYLHYRKAQIQRLRFDMSLVYSWDPKSILELRPSFGTVFEDYIQGYTHWAYLDVDQVLGDLPAWMSMDEFMEYDIVTYMAGDNNRVYIRGPFTMFNQSSAVHANTIWSRTPYMGSHLREYFQFKHVRCVEKKSFMNRDANVFPFGCSMTPDESVFSSAVLKVPNIRIKYSNKNRADPNSNSAYPKPQDGQIYYIDGSIRFCIETLQNKKNKELYSNDDRTCDILQPSAFRLSMIPNSKLEEQEENRNDKINIPIPLEVNPEFPGTQIIIKQMIVNKPIPSGNPGCLLGWIAIFGGCFPTATRKVNILFIAGKWYHEFYILPEEKRGRVDAMVMHFRMWKRSWTSIQWPSAPPEGGGRYVFTKTKAFQYDNFLKKTDIPFSSRKLPPPLSIKYKTIIVSKETGAKMRTALLPKQ